MRNKSVAKDQPFWKTKPLGDMTQDEWESLCDGCGQCCLFKFKGEKPGGVYHTNVACRLFDDDKYRCTSYDNRADLASNCIVLTPDDKVHSSVLIPAPRADQGYKVQVVTNAPFYPICKHSCKENSSWTVK